MLSWGNIKPFRKARVLDICVAFQLRGQINWRIFTLLGVDLSEDMGSQFDSNPFLTARTLLRCSLVRCVSLGYIGLCDALALPRLYIYILFVHKYLRTILSSQFSCNPESHSASAHITFRLTNALL